MTTPQATSMPAPNPRSVPGPGWRILTRLSELRQDPLAFFRQLESEYGGLLKLNIMGRTFYLVSHPDYVKYVLQDNNRNYIKGDSVELARLLVGYGLATSDGDLWLSQRRLMQPAFHRKRLEALAGLMTGTADDYLKKWESYQRENESFDMVSELMTLTLQVIVSTMFTHDISGQAEELGEAFTEALRYIDRQSFGSWAPPLWVPTPSNQKVKKSIETIDRIVYSVADGRRGNENDYQDLLSMLMLARDADTGEGMSPKQLRDEIVTVFFAGHETTALTLTWAIAELFEHPEVELKLREEVSRVLAGRIPTVEDLSQLQYTRMILDETLRRYPPAWIFARSSVDEDVIDGFRIPANADVFVSPYVTHHLTEFWDDPDSFRPERFDPEAETDLPKMAYFPFGAGPRLCIGREFALMEATLLLAMIVQRFQLQPAPDYHAEAVPLVTLRPKGNFKVQIN